MPAIPGLHHVTAIARSAQDNLDWYTRDLGLRLVKRTVNFDAPDVWHLYYADRTGTPGTVLTFFPFPDAAPGRAGPGTAAAHGWAVPPAAFDRWLDHAALTGAEFDGPEHRFGARVLTLHDPDGAPVELIETPDAPAEDRPGFGGLHSVTLWQDDPEPTARLLTDHFGYTHAGEETTGTTTRWRLTAPGTGPGRHIDLIRRPAVARPRQGAGSIHHIAFRAPGIEDQLVWQDRLRSAGYDVTGVKDRQYFRAIYFREPGGVLFEIATDAPGFAVDEPVETLGQALKLPPQYEPRRAGIAARLPPLDVPA
ncbi:MAG: ring-cleaving dioxygenase [Gemmobacter sp.]